MSERLAMANSSIDLLATTSNGLNLGIENPAVDDSAVQPNTQQPAETLVSCPNGVKRSAVVQFLVDEEEEDTNTETCSKRKNKSNDKGHSRSILLSAMYAIILILVGFIFPVTEALRDTWINNNLVGAFLVYLYAPSIFFLIYVQIYHVRGHKHLDSSHTNHDPEDQNHHVSQEKMKNNNDMVLRAVRRSSVNLVQQGSETIATISKAPTAESPPSYHQRPVSSSSEDMSFEEEEVHEYITLRTGTATLSHEGTSFYLRLGCLLFAIGNLIFISLKIEYEFGFHSLPECKTDKVQYPIFFRLIFTVVQTFFLFKNCSLVITKHKHWVRFGLMHVLATNMCVWLRVLVEEVMHGIHSSHHDDKEIIGGDGILPNQEHDSPVNVTSPCKDSSSSLLSLASPFLFPFVLEYSLIAVAAMASMYYALGIHVSRDILDAVRRALRAARRKGEELLTSHHKSPFDKAHVGTFLGVVVMAGTLVTLVLFYYWSSSKDTLVKADYTFQMADATLNSIMMVACIVGMVQLYPLGFDLNRDNSIDHNLLLLSMMGFIILEGFSLLASFVSISHDGSEMDKLHTVNGVTGVLACIQGILQTIFIIDGMQRFCESQAQLQKKPGRGIITFLIVTNVATWIFKSFGEKELSIQGERDFYGDVAWPLILSICMPLLLFFRFHSSICLAHMWHSTYKEEDNILADKQILQ